MLRHKAGYNLRFVSTDLTPTATPEHPPDVEATGVKKTNMSEQRSIVSARTHKPPLSAKLMLGSSQASR